MAQLKSVEEFYESVKMKKGYKSLYQLYIKRLIDILVCLLALPFAMLIMIPVSVAIIIEDRGPVFYSSKRVGINFKEFGMIKIRFFESKSSGLRNGGGKKVYFKN